MSHESEYLLDLLYLLLTHEISQGKKPGLNTLAPDTVERRRRERRRPEAFLTECMLALLVNSLGFTPGLRPAPSIESPVAMRFRDVDFGGVFMKT